MSKWFALRGVVRLRMNDLDFKAGTIRVDESADQRTYIIVPCKNVAVYWTVLLAETEGREALLMLKRFLKGPQTQTSFVFRSKRGTALRETSVLHTFLHPVLRTLGFPQAGVHAFCHGCNPSWELSGMNHAVLRQQMGHSSAVMTARFTGEIPLDKVRKRRSPRWDWKIWKLLENGRAVPGAA